MNMKNIIKRGWLWVLAALLVASCSDMLETDSTRQNIDPDITAKTDSVFYSFGILQALQELADQYVFQGEMRGDLVDVTRYSDNNLRQLYDYSAGTDNKYDSAYVYYRVINNCNYYIAHCDTNQYSGSTNVVINKYAATKAIRAWAYLQLARNWGKVPFFTEPLTQISDIDRNYPELSLEEIVDRLAPDLEYYTGMRTPELGFSGNSATGIGSPNWESTAKLIAPWTCFIPVDVVLGDMYAEAGRYGEAAKHFITYLTKVCPTVSPDVLRYSQYTAPLAEDFAKTIRGIEEDIPSRSQISVTNDHLSWSGIFGRNSLGDLVSLIPMATTSQNGKTTNVPLAFGFNYYATSEERERSTPYVDEIQIVPSSILKQLSDSTEYYYYAAYQNQRDPYDTIAICRAGDMRLRSIQNYEYVISTDSLTLWYNKYKYANILLYRVSTIWLRLAECFNRLDMPDVAFAILKDGINEFMLQRDDNGEYTMPYLSNYSRQQLQTVYPLLSTENLNLFSKERTCGIHIHGAGRAVSNYPGGTSNQSATYHSYLKVRLDENGDTVKVNDKPVYDDRHPYNFDRIVGKKLAEIAKYTTVGTTRQDTINAMEDIICDEYALETAFEGNRYFDLLRLAKNKDRAGVYSGDQWLTQKLGYKGWTPAKKYLPFK